jgi:hypothetical protein
MSEAALSLLVLLDLEKLGLAFSFGDQFTCSVMHSGFLGLFLCDTPVHQRHPFNSTVYSQTRCFVLSRSFCSELRHLASWISRT